MPASPHIQKAECRDTGNTGELPTFIELSRGPGLTRRHRHQETELRIAATLAGAVLVGLLMLPAAAQAASTPPGPPPARRLTFAEPEQAAIAGGFELAPEEGEAGPLLLKKRRKPQFQTRFFAE
jgi:hypothetical protein